MGCGMSKSNLIDDAFGKRTTASSKLLIKDSPRPQPSSIVDKPPELQKIKTNVDNNNNGGGGGMGNSNVDPLWFGSPSFREYIKSSPLATATGNEHGEKEAVIGTQGGQISTCTEEGCEWGHSRENMEQDKKETRVGRFRKVFKVHKVTLWHGGPWHIGHPKATKKAA